MPVKAPWACKCGKRIADGHPCPCCSTARKRAYESQRPSARARGYDSKWDRERGVFLAANPWCVKCAAYGTKTPATVVNHIIPHKMDLRLFWNRRNWEAVCGPCHNGPIQSAEKRSGGQRWAYSIPSDIQPSISPVMLVCGPPASGKTTYVKARAQPNDTIIDLDDYTVQAGGRRWETDKTIVRAAFALRDAALHRLATKPTRMAWLIVLAPTQDERSKWRAALGDVSMVVLDTPIDVCIDRIKRDPSRAHAAPRLIALANSWPTGRGRSKPRAITPEPAREPRSLHCGIEEKLETAECQQQL